MNLNDMLTKNYNDIALRAKRITQRKNPGKHNDLINSTYLAIHEKEINFTDGDDMFVRFFSRWMKNIYLFNDSPFNKIHIKVDNSQSIEDIESLEELPIEIDIEKCKSVLLEHEQILFELRFERGITNRKIAELYTGDGYRITRQSINAMINNIKNKIKRIHYEQCY